MDEACFGCRDIPANSSRGLLNRDGTVPARARRTVGEPSVDGTSRQRLIDGQSRTIPSGMVGSIGVLLGELFEVPIEPDQK